MAKAKTVTRNTRKFTVTCEQALACLNYKVDGRVHSFWNELFLSGADLERDAVLTMVRNAETEGKLFFSDELSAMHHNIVAWDQKYQKWTYLECDTEEIVKLEQSHS